MSVATILHDMLGLVIVRARTMDKLQQQLDLLDTELTQERNASQASRVNELLTENMQLTATNSQLLDTNAQLDIKLLDLYGQTRALEQEQDRLIALLRSYDIDTTSQPRKRRAKRKPSTTDKLVAVEVE